MVTTTVRHAAILGAMLLAACSSPIATTPPAATPTFDIGAMRANFTAECKNPAVVDDLFCVQVQVNGMAADGEILNVPTTLNTAARDRGSELCRQIAVAHFDEQGRDLGYKFIGILDKDRGHLAACSV